MIGMLVTHAPLVALLAFFVAFLGIVVWVMRPGAKQSFEQQRHIPLTEDSNGR